jgi:glycosyltransferase involved in cell wall biosynthesis
MIKLSAIVITKNEEDVLEAALKSLKFVDEIIVADSGSTDNTLKIAKKYATKIVKTTGESFAQWRNQALESSKGEWILYLDADERIPPKLAGEILANIKEPIHDAYTIPRYEVLLGKHLPHWPDPYVLRLIKRSSISKWKGALHEQPDIKGTIGKLKEQMIHLTHRDLTSMIAKTSKWSIKEAVMLKKANHPKMAGWRFFRIILTELYLRLIKQGLWRDGTEGVIEALFQSFSRFFTYVRLWEMQRDPSLTKTYKHIDRKILEEWDKEG